MRTSLLCVGKTNEQHILQGVEIYTRRLSRYTTYSNIVVAESKKGLTPELQKLEEGRNILKKVSQEDFLILLDEKGAEMTSVEFAKFIEKHSIQSTKSIIFVIGGAFGFSEEVYKRANFKMALSAMTFSHQLVRLIFVEQLYRAYTIIKGEPYHHI